MRAFSPLLDRALTVASLVHHGATRKGTFVPYIMHPVHVALILHRHGAEETLVIAGLLHDVLEDGDWDSAELRRQLRGTFPGSALAAAPDQADPFGQAVERFLEDSFGGQVVQLVRAVTEKKKENGRARPWMDRKREQLAHLDGAKPPHAMLKAADALHNVSQLIGDLDRARIETMGRFRAGPCDTLWYYASVAGKVGARLEPGHALGLELRAAVDVLASHLERQHLVSADDARNALAPLWHR